ncbi:MAG: amidase [Anaerolineae bacterium]|nr:amidase [Anaerolineae bacterium]
MKRRSIATVINLAMSFGLGAVLLTAATKAAKSAPAKKKKEGVFKSPRIEIGLEPIYSGKRVLDFTPFADALPKMTASKAAALDKTLLTGTITDIYRLVEAGKLTFEQLTLYYLYRIKRYDVGKLQSVGELNPVALDIARERDAEWKAGKRRGALHGIPVLLKDNIGTGDGLHNTAGVKALVEERADRDAFLVTRLREAGAIILGKANMSEWAYWMSSKAPSGFSANGGQVRNPYGKYDPSGSSSGSAVAAAANLATVTVGSETTGSITSPSSANTVVGIKPSLGVVSRDRIIPICDYMDTAGPITRTVTDAAILLGALSGSDANDSITAKATSLHGKDFTAYLKADGLRGARIGVPVPSDPTLPKKKTQFLQFDQSILATLREAGAELIEVPLDLAISPFAESDEKPYLAVLSYGFRAGVNQYLAATNSRVKSVAEIVAFNQADPTNRVPYGQDLVEGSENIKLTEAEYHTLAQGLAETRQKLIRQVLNDYRLDALITNGSSFSPIYCPPGFPALTVPAGYKRGRPFGITFVGDYLSEPTLIRLGYAFEQTTQARRSPRLETTKASPRSTRKKK